MLSFQLEAGYISFIKDAFVYYRIFLIMFYTLGMFTTECKKRSRMLIVNA